MAPILSAAEVLRAAGPLEDPRMEWARETISRQVRHMARLLEDLLDLSRITMGKIRIRKRRIHLREVVERALGTLRGRIEKRGQELSLSLPAESVWLEADPDRIEQVLVNLLANASSYTDEGGSIRVSAECDGDEVVICVEDDGVGMDPDTLKSVFEPFTQGAASADRSEAGLGIGLSLARTLVELHGGSIRARSAGPGEGSEFEVRLPRVGDASRARTSFDPDPVETKHGPRVSKQEAVDLEGLSVLVVDDNGDAAEGLRLLLGSWGCEVKVAHNGSTALEMARRSAPAIVFLDIGLPDLDGYAVAKELRDDPRTMHVRIVGVSGYGQRRDRERARSAGFDRYLVKPVHPPSLRQLLAALDSEIVSSLRGDALLRAEGEPPCGDQSSSGVS